MEHRVTKIEELRANRGFLARVDGEEIALFKIDGKVCAIGNVCSHQHFSMLHQGEVKGFTITCPMHGWTYDLNTGVSTNASGRVKTYEAIVRGEEVFIRKNDDAH